MTAIKNLPKGFITADMKANVVAAYSAEQAAFDSAFDKRFEVAKALGVIYAKIEDAIETGELKAGAFRHFVENTPWVKPVSYTHLTLPTICSV